MLPSLTNADGGAFDPLSDALPASFTQSTIRPDLIGAQGFGNLTIAAYGQFLLPASTALSLPAGGSFSVSAGLVDIEGGIYAPGGAINATAGGSSLGSGPAVPYALALGPRARS